MDPRSELGEFLRSRRARTKPEDLGLPGYGHRRVPGLRREELARLAGISVGYYTRLEQGHGAAVSDSVLDSLAGALRLAPDERAHLRSLTRPRRKSPTRAGPEHVRDGVRLLVDSLGHLPALVLGRSGDVLTWNRLAHALLAGHLPLEAPERVDNRPNWTKLFFLDPRMRELFADWLGKARDTVADVRLALGGHPDDGNLTELVGELLVESTEFRALWSEHPIRRCTSHDRGYHHPVVGDLTLSDELLTLPDDDGQRLVVFNATPASPSAAALGLLAELTAGDPGKPRPARRSGRGQRRIG
ncbi:helix-turn-helix transcriptional regulator [Actinokineospora sp. PR83]|uniref:helix-turn-helix transcriptional regulator n=1 Tax=Actinokineospora sp. PR83 TaxID=2884908 RepID=UPI0027DED850|nr:helix-turn-helix transcriptional regulator [Actinokineospora sp. PR83]MCG8914329.1 helix-turn-helix transcriptional regulator [Actinokineospora sp. PR83]